MIQVGKEEQFHVAGPEVGRCGTVGREVWPGVQG